MGAPLFTALLFAAAGAVSLLAALMGWPWFFRAAQSAWLLRRLGMRGARLAYGAAGLLLLAMAAWLLASLFF